MGIASEKHDFYRVPLSFCAMDAGDDYWFMRDADASGGIDMCERRLKDGLWEQRWHL
jgi:hypothetical protein